MKKYLVFVMLVGLAVFLVASSVQTVLPITAINTTKIEMVQAVWPPSEPSSSRFSINTKKIDAVLVDFSEQPCSSISCVESINVHMQSGDIYVLLKSHIQFSPVLKEYTGIGPGTLGNIYFTTPIEYLTVHTISGNSYHVSSEDSQFEGLLEDYFGQ